MSERTRYLTTSKNLLSSGADAVERLMSSYKVRADARKSVYRINETQIIRAEKYSADSTIGLISGTRFSRPSLAVERPLDSDSGTSKIVRFRSKQELVALAGYAARVSEMLDVFKDAALCKYQRNVVASGPSRLTNGSPQQPLEKIIEFSNGTPLIKGKFALPKNGLSQSNFNQENDVTTHRETARDLYRVYVTSLISQPVRQATYEKARTAV